MAELSRDEARRIGSAILVILAIWGSAVAIAAAARLIHPLPTPLIGAFIAVTIILPMLAYAASPKLKAFADQVGHRPIVLFHIWRIGAALLLFWYGFAGALPAGFWIPAGVGDLLAGLFAIHVLTQPESRGRYLAFHLFGLADFIVAVGAGLYFSLRNDPLMLPVALLPLALIPLYGVGISSVSHLVALDMLRRGTGMGATLSGRRR
ncbi:MULTISPECIES: permease [unclassified Bosea (in: a-proteobacteria)]|uniref:permease n=1 Tax=unclassified Bosea (in: a-proteobacteria) TaxID=2653178 RepID=UPI000F756112|nr:MULTISPECIES: permease [unclassified Bosea (in: a-proteobacteria)]AZO78006.1 permease [Bosea sp. Tri-49]RXT19234.1 permease [Bosea sp. Tri-39]RXT41506.1 permease [Bosea sp. Tri-54]